MGSDNHIRMTGTVIEHMHDIFRIAVDPQESGQLVKAKLSGKMRLNKINLQLGDRVVVEVSVYDLTMGRIVQRDRDASKNRTPRE